MSKIPPGEWSAIAARHAKGESLSAIARSYGCTPPAIHYVLKRNGQQAAEKVEQPVEATPPPSSAPAKQAQPPAQRPNGEIRLVSNRENGSVDEGSREPARPLIAPLHREQPPAPELQRQPSPS